MRLGEMAMFVKWYVVLVLQNDDTKTAENEIKKK